MPRIDDVTDNCRLPLSYWEEVDAVLIINLETRTDRWKRFLERAGSMFPAEKLHRLEAVCGKEILGYGEAPWFSDNTGERAAYWAGVAGCALSHRKAMEITLQNGWEKVLICEDDIEPADPCSLQDIRELLRHADKRSCLYLGYHMPTPYGRRVLCAGQSELWVVEGVLSTHSYIVSAEACRRLLPHMPEPDRVWAWVARYRAIDTFYRDWARELAGISSYIVWPVLFRQDESCSDIDAAHNSVPEDRCAGRPVSWCTFRGWLHLLMLPFRRLKLRLNAWRTYRRARLHGLPGYRSRKSDKK